MEDRYLFKAKTVTDGTWVQGYYVYDYGRDIHYIFANEIACPNCINDRRKDFSLQDYEIDPSTLCHCTGMRDKNAKLIWENDIVKKGFYIDYDSVYQEEHVTSVISEEYVGTIKFEHFAWVVGIFNDHLKCILPICELSEHSEDIKYFEIVGDIFDNPKLLESEG